MNEIDIHSIISSVEVAGAENQTQHRPGWAFGAVIGLIILAAIILRLAAAELVPGWVVIPVLGIVVGMYAYILWHTGAGKNEE